MEILNYEEIKDLVVKTILFTFAKANEKYPLPDIRKKEGNDIVTEVDTFMEKNIISVLKETFPNHFFSSEEKGKALIDITEDVYEWVIDPIDGTINFKAGLPFYTTSVSLKHNDEIVLGVIVHHSSGDIYTAIKGKGAFCNDKRIFVSNTKDLQNSVLSFMLTSHYTEEQTDKILDIVRKLSLKTRGLRLLVSQAYELALIAKGELDGTVCIKSRGFSSSAGALLVKEAGGTITDIYGKQRTNTATSLLVSNGVLHDEIVRAL